MASGADHDSTALAEVDYPRTAPLFDPDVAIVTGQPDAACSRQAEASVA